MIGGVSEVRTALLLAVVGGLLTVLLCLNFRVSRAATRTLALSMFFVVLILVVVFS